MIPYILIAIIVLLAIFVIIMIFIGKKKPKPLSPLVGLALVLIITGINFSVIFDGHRLIGYSLLGIGVILAIVDIVKKSKAKNKPNE